MKKYLKWNETTIEDFSDKNINRLYNDGYVFTRKGKGVMNQTRSLRIDLDKFELSSENRRILRKTKKLKMKIENIPYKNYNWKIGKLAKDFYDEKFEKGIFSANKIKEILTTEYNFNKFFIYNNNGYAICRETDEILHYSYPFYNLEYDIPNLGMGMMIKAIKKAKENNKKYIYLGSASRPTDKYKLQFKGLEWFDGEEWSENLGKLKKIIKKSEI